MTQKQNSADRGAFSLESRAGSGKSRNLQNGMFPFEAFEFESPGRTGEPELTLRSPWRFVLSHLEALFGKFAKIEAAEVETPLIEAPGGQDINYVTTDSGVHRFEGGAVHVDIVTHQDAVTFGEAQMPVPDGDTPVFACRAWLHAGATTIVASGNFATFTRINTGRYELSFATPMPDANYAVIATASRGGVFNSGTDNILAVYNQTVNGFDLQNTDATNNTYQNFDNLGLAVFR